MDAPADFNIDAIDQLLADHRRLGAEAIEQGIESFAAFLDEHGIGRA